MQDRPLIVGAGPTGLAAALFLAHKGVSPRVIDRAPAPERQSRALIVNPRTLDLLEPTGVADAILAEGHRLRRVCFYENWSPVAELALEPKMRFLVALPQARVETLLREALFARGVEVERGLRFEKLAQDGEGVVATLADADGARENARAPLLLGADGAHSRVRDALAIAFEGSSFPEDWPLCDLRLDDPLDPESVHVCFIRGGLIVMLALAPGLWRAFGNVPDLLYRLPPGTKLGATEWMSSFHIGHRVAARETSGRVLLAGDAAHIHSPIGARGMNLGVEDAHVFAECAADALGGNPSRLDDYDRLRRDVHRDVVGRMKTLTTFSRGRPNVLGASRPWLIALMTRFPPIARVLRDTLTGLDHEVRTR
jgi:2-polyprenyl-6-methoxyphenol hydroxylase-like FAD-dependent oxidoreductase